MQPEQLTVGEKILNLLMDPIFWLGSGLVALVMNVIANYATRGTDKIISLFSTRRRQAIEQKNQFIYQEAERLLNNPGERFDVKLDVLFYLLRTILLFLMGMTFLFFPC